VRIVRGGGFRYQSVEFRQLAEANWAMKAAENELVGLLARQRWTPAEVYAEDPDLPSPREELDRDIERAREFHEDAEFDFMQTKTLFESRHGQIVDYYFSRTVKEAGAALTYHRRRLVQEAVQLHVHNLVLYTLPDVPELASLRVRVSELLHRIDAKQLSVQYMLRGLSQRVLALRLFALRRDILSDLDSIRESLLVEEEAATVSVPSDQRTAARLQREHQTRIGKRLQAIDLTLHDALDGYEAEYAEISNTYAQAATREARIIYLTGMLVGLCLLAGLTALLWLVFKSAARPLDRNIVFICIAAGAVGAFVSVLQRMSAGKFTVNHEVGREYVQRLAWFRPFLGSVFGVAVYFAITSGIAHITPPPPIDEAGRYSFYAFIAFLAGFSERFARELLGSPSGTDTEGADISGETVSLSQLQSGDGRVPVRHAPSDPPLDPRDL